MKRTKLFGLLMAMIMGISFTACEEDEVSISILIPNPPTEVVVGQTLEFNYSVVLENNKLESVEILQNYDTYDYIDVFSNNLTYNGTFSFTAYEDQIGIQNFAIEVTDNKGNIERQPFSFEVIAAPGDINTYTAVLLGNQSSTTGSFYSTSTNQVFQLSQSAANAAKIDFVYLLDETKHVIAAPSDAFVPTKFGGVADWTPRNATKLKITLLSPEAFDAISNDAEITEQTNVDLSKVSDLAVGDVVAFTTAQDKKGLFKIEAMANNTMTIQVKVQE